LGYLEAFDIFCDLDLHISLDTSDKPSAVRLLVDLLKSRHLPIAFAALWMLIDGDKLKPNQAQDFDSRRRPEIDPEFDHRGSFREL
jgi:hypothetical protein